MSDTPTPDRWERDKLIQLGERFEGLRNDVNRHAEADEEMHRKFDEHVSALRDLINNKDHSLRELLEARDKETEKRYVTKDEFNPTRMIAYGLVGLIVVAVVTAWLSIVVVGKIHTP